MKRVELKRKLNAMGIPVTAGKVKKSDVQKVVLAAKNPINKVFDTIHTLKDEDDLEKLFDYATGLPELKLFDTKEKFNDKVFKQILKLDPKAVVYVKDNLIWVSENVGKWKEKVRKKAEKMKLKLKI